MSARRRALAATPAAAVLVAAGCGGESGDTAVDAREQNTVRIDGLSYRAVLFRELNPRVPPDRSLVERGAPAQGVGLYAAFIRVCNDSGEPRQPTGDIHLENAFGDRFSPRGRSGLAYRPQMLEHGACIPADNSVAAETFNGAPLVFRVPFDAAQERPMVLEIQPRAGADPVRIELDL